MPELSKKSIRRQQKAAERTGVNLLRHFLNHPDSTCGAAAADLRMSVPNVCRLVAGFKEAGILVGDTYKQTGKRGPRSLALRIKPDLGCAIGVDLEATHVRGIALDFANNPIGILRQPIPETAGPNEVICAVAEVAGVLETAAEEQGFPISAVGLGLPGTLHHDFGGNRAHFQFGPALLEFVPVVQGVCGVKTVIGKNSHCFAIGHHRTAPSRGIEAVVLNRFGVSAAAMLDGNILTGASNLAGEVGMIKYAGTSRRLQDVCTGSAILTLARRRGDRRSLQEILSDPEGPIIREWLETAIPAFAQAVFITVAMFNPHHLIVEGIFNQFHESVHEAVRNAMARDLSDLTDAPPPIEFNQDDGLMGARGAAFLARDSVADEILAGVVSL